MQVPKNAFKAALKGDTPVFGCWLGLAEPYLAEISGSAGFDWLVVDGEHAPNDLRSITAQLQVLKSGTSPVMVRPPAGEAWRIKQLLDAGAQSLLIPMVESGAEAEALVRAVAYPPQGIRGVGAALARASEFGGIADYIHAARDEICLVVQVETRKGLAALDDILAVDGIDGVFIGPSDLAADLGHPGDIKHADVLPVVLDTLSRIAASNKAAGVMALDREMQMQCLDAGARFVATHIDVALFAGAMRAAGREIDTLR